MVTIRLHPTGAKKKPFYRIVAIDARQKLAASPLEILGFWHPQKDTLKLDREKLAAWVQKGARVSNAVAKLLPK
ncbi:MAG: 30S ribosomal protein S16 [Patescibacteria group bacterium]